MLRRLLKWARALVMRGRMEREMDAEMRFHLDMLVEENKRRGMTEKQALDAALRDFGGMERHKDKCRDVRRGTIIESFIQDVRFGARILIKNPGYTFIAVLTLALGIGANTAIFSVIYGVIMKPLPYTDEQQLVVLNQQAPLAGVKRLGFSVKEIQDYRERSQTLDAVVEHHTMSFILLGRKEAERVQTGVVSANFFDVLGVRPFLGRTFLPDDEQQGSEAVLVLSYKYWQQSHGGDTGIIGKVFQMNNRPHTVVGVLPPIPQYPDEQDIYMPTSHCPTRSLETFIANRNARMMDVFCRVRPGVTVEQAQNDLSLIAAHMQKESPDSYPENRGFAITAASLHDQLTRQARPTFLVLFATAGLVLLLACANVANLSLARLMRREREMAIRAALGAGRGRLIRQLVTESLLVSLVGGAIGLLLAAWVLDMLVGFAAKFTPRASEINIDVSVLLFTLAVSVLTGLAFGLIPAFSSEKNSMAALKESGGRTSAGTKRQRIRNALIVAQVAISFMLLIGAGLMLRSLVKLQNVNPGFNPDSVLVMRISPNWSKYNQPEQYRTLFTRVIEDVKHQPGVLSAALSNNYPLNSAASTNGPSYRSFRIENREIREGELAPRIVYRVITPDYFQTLRMAMTSGRQFSDADDANATRVAIINPSAAAHRWPDDDPLGKRIKFNDDQGWLTIVGVVGDVRYYGLNQEPADEVYVPHAQDAFTGFLLVRAASDPMSIAGLMRETIYRIDSEMAVDRVQTLEQVRSESVASPRLTTILLAMFAGLALVITAAGIAGVMALTVSQRTRELGIRLALGASPTSVLRLVMKQGLALVLVGLALGVGGALALTRLMTALLFSTAPTDVVTFFAVGSVLLSVAALACFVPARRVTAIDPMLALRSD